MKKESQKIILKIFLIGFFLLLVFWANTVAVNSEMIKELVGRFGYLGILIASAISGFNLLVPIPIISFFPFFLEAGFQPLITLGIISLGMTLGDFLGFLIGRTGREVYQPKEKKIFNRLERLRQKNPRLPLIFMFFYATFAPIPNEIVVIPLAFLGFKLWKVMAVVFLGNIIFNSLLAFGVLQVFQLF